MGDYMCAKKNCSTKKVSLSNTHVPDKVYAYSLQVRHVLYELLGCSDGDIVSVEVFDDIGVEKADHTVEAIQVKSALSDRNPVSNRATDLWKTFHNWLLSVQEKELQLNDTIFKLFITVDRHGSIVDSFDAANTLEKSQEVWESAREEFYDNTGVEKKLSNEYAFFIRYFFDNDNKELACGIIERFRLGTIDKKHTEFLYDHFKKTLIPDDIREYVLLYILGWIDKKTAEKVESKKPVIVSYDEFKRELTAIYREVNQKQSLKEIAPKPSDEEVKKEYGSLKTYVEQLNIINCDYTDQLEAINDYLRASANRTAWANRGDISQESIITYEDELKRTWNNKKRIINILNKDLNLEEKGQLLYFDCQDKNIDMGHLGVPSFFTSGCYHVLADGEIIGWHPNYKEKLKERRNNDGKSG